MNVCGQENQRQRRDGERRKAYVKKPDIPNMIDHVEGPQRNLFAVLKCQWRSGLAFGQV
jgi:hypothetical protein